MNAAIYCYSISAIKNALAPPAGALAHPEVWLKKHINIPSYWLHIFYVEFINCLDVCGPNFISQKHNMVFTFPKKRNKASLVMFQPLPHWWTDFDLAILPEGDTWLPALSFRAFTPSPWPGWPLWYVSLGWIFHLSRKGEKDWGKLQ